MIVSRAQLQRICRRLRRRGKVIVTTNGSFDLVHAGHIHVLQRAKRLGDVLIVGVNSDSSVRKYKGKGRPILPDWMRAGLVDATRYVDYVYIFPETNPIRFLDIVRPQVHVNSAEYGKDCIEAPVVRKYGGRLVLVPKLKRFLSTTEIISKIRRLP